MNHAPLRNWRIDEVSKKKIVSVNFCHALFCLLHFLTLEAVTDRLSKNVSTELPLYFIILQKSTDLIWFGDAGLGLAARGLVQSDPVCRSLVRRCIREFKM